MIKKIQKIFLVCVAALTVTSHAQASGTYSSSVRSGTWVYMYIGNMGQSVYASLTGKYGMYTKSDLLGNGTVVTNKATTLANLQTMTTAMNHRLDALGSGGGKMAQANSVYTTIAGRGKGTSAGSDQMNWGLWLSTAYTDYKVSDPYIGISGDVWAAALGTDYRLNDMFTVGLALNYAHENAKTTFLSEKVRSNGYGLTPYAKVVFSKNFDADIMASYLHITSKTSRKNTRWNYNILSTSAVDGTLSGSPKADQFSGRVAFNAHVEPVECVMVSAQIGADYAQRKQKAFSQKASFKVQNMTDDRAVSAVTAKAGRAFANLKVGFMIAEGIMPFIKGGYLYDLVSSKKSPEYDVTNTNPLTAKSTAINFKNDRSNYIMGGGIIGKFDSFLITAEYSHFDGARKFKSDTGMLTVRYEF
ncbi:MAG: autotransporter outer membrane beta-barrel domain-containing protein [Alphaproteobacteria bacterium]|nr:MAG: autotransporter outer membrane beta-barrel domain-containing protein [Alphaproteobacteria bacterium]